MVRPPVSPQEAARSRCRAAARSVKYFLYVGSTLLRVGPWLLVQLGLRVSGLVPSWLGGAVGALVLRCAFVSVACMTVPTRGAWWRTTTDSIAGMLFEAE
jgi:hypothetical protein